MTGDSIDRGFQDDLAAYALGALDAERRREIEARLEVDAQLRAELEEYELAASALAFMAPPSEPPRHLKTRLLKRFDQEVSARNLVSAPVPLPQPSAWTRFRRRFSSARLAYAAPTAVIGAFAAGAVSILIFNSMVDPRIDKIEQLSSEAATIESTMAELEKTATELEKNTASRVEEARQEIVQSIEERTDSRLAIAQAQLESLSRAVEYQSRMMELLNREEVTPTWLAGQGQASGASAVLAANRSAGRPAVLWVKGLQPPPDNTVYQLWLFSQGRMWSPGTFTVEANGYAYIEFVVAQPLPSPVYAAVTLEPLGGSDSPTGANVLGPRP